MSRLLHIPSLLRAALVGCGYFVAAMAMIGFARFGPGVTSLWLATALLLAELLLIDRRDWPVTIGACAIGAMAATGLLGFGWVAAAPLMLVNMSEAVLGALLLLSFRQGRIDLSSVSGLAIFVALGCLIPSVAAGFIGATLVSSAIGLDFANQWFAWTTGHSLGTIAFTPVATLLRSGELGRSLRQSSARSRVEAVVLITVTVAISLAVFSQERLPLLFLPMLPLIVIAFRLGRSGTAVAVVLLAMIGGLASANGHGPFNMIQLSHGARAQLFQFYLAVTMLTVLPVSAQLARSKDLFRRLHDSEARYKLITESSTDIIVTLDRTGLASYVSPSLAEITGFRPEDLLGRQLLNLIESPDAAAVSAAYARVARDPSATASVEFRGRIASGDERWFEAHIRAIRSSDGCDSVGTGWVSAIRDISRRKMLELRLAHAATTDSLTGLANRRSFDLMLERKINDRRAGEPGGCVAIFDIDFFKRVNDVHGHAVGDLVLEAFATSAQRVLRGGDHLARLGGEEFGLILSGTDLDQASRICERMRVAIAANPIIAADGRSVSITVSAGIASIEGAESPKQVLRAADAALYRAKGAGRDRLAIAA